MIRNILAISAALCTCTAVHAETLPVGGVYAAQASIDPRIDTIILESFGGDAGTELSFLLGDLLESVEIDGEPWFQILPMATPDIANGRVRKVTDSSEVSSEDPLVHNAVLRGTARSQFNDYSTSPKKVKECVKKIDGDCVERKLIVYECRNLSVGYTPSLRLISSYGEIIYESSEYLEANSAYCEDENDEPDANGMLAALASQYAQGVRRELAPQYKRNEIRILERRKGLSKADARKFREAVLLTKNDPINSCLRFHELEEANPEHGSVLFNIGLCNESEGRLEEARDYYIRTESIEPGKNLVDAGLNRIASRLEAERQLLVRISSN